MARLFIGQREVDFFSDITKELIKDVVGQRVYYYVVREDLSNVHEIYEESLEKVFDPPISFEAMVEWNPSVVKTNRFGHENIKTITVYIHNRDLLDRDIEFETGNFISYGEYFFEITSILYDKLVYGQIERVVSIKLTCMQSRKMHVNKQPIGPTYEGYSDSDSVQTTFEQQRGTNTSDVRQLKKDGVLENSISGPKKVAPDGTEKSINKIGSSFYGDD